MGYRINCGDAVHIGGVCAVRADVVERYRREWQQQCTCRRNADDDHREDENDDDNNDDNDDDKATSETRSKTREEQWEEENETISSWNISFDLFSKESVSIIGKKDHHCEIQSDK